MMIQPYLEFFLRDLDKLKEELSLYKNENDLWTVKGDIQNSAGTLTLHLVGNLKHFIGAQIGFTGYIRNRDREFPVEMYGARRTTGYIMLSLSTHFCYHLGQINYHRRLLA
jgi:hypothetical protein